MERLAEVEPRTGADLRNELDQLRAENESLRTFAYIAAHELAGPARRILMHLQLLDHDDSEGDRTARLERIRSTAAQLTGLVSDLLAIASLESEEVECDLVDLAPIVEELAGEAASPAPETVISLGPLPQAFANEQLLRLLFANIFDNAVKFSSPERALAIDVRAHVEGDACVISVTDNGIGIDPKDAESMFEPLVRLQGKSQYQGSGLGLTLARRIARWHGGDVTAAPSASGRGTTVQVILPVADQPTAEPAASRA